MLGILLRGAGAGAARVGVRAAARIGAKQVSRRDILKFSRDYIAVPTAVGFAIDQLPEDSILQENRFLLMALASVASGFGPANIVRAVKGAPKAALKPMASLRASGGAALLAGQVFLRGGPSRMSQKMVDALDAMQVTRNVGETIINLGRYGSLIFSGKGAGLKVAATTSGLAAALAANEFALKEGAVADNLDHSAFGDSAVQIGAQILSDIAMAQFEEMKDRLSLTDPIETFRSFGIVSDTLKREHDLLESQEIVAAMFNSSATELDVAGTAGVYVDSYTDAEGDEILQVNGTSYTWDESVGVISGATFMRPVKAGPKDNERVDPELQLFSQMLIVFFEKMARKGKYVFVKGDNNKLYSNVLFYHDASGGKRAVGLSIDSETKLICPVLYEGGWLSNVESAVNSLSTRNMLESALDRSSAWLDEQVSSAAAMVGLGESADRSLKSVQEWHTAYSADGTVEHVQGSRLDAKPGTYVNFAVEEIASYF